MDTGRMLLSGQRVRGVGGVVDADETTVVDHSIGVCANAVRVGSCVHGDDERLCAGSVDLEVPDDRTVVGISVESPARGPLEFPSRAAGQG
jgi:hypothetical protein